MDAEHANTSLCLPYDILLDVLRRLPIHALAMSSCVCREWRDIVDAQTLLFPREFAGVFAGYKGYDPGFALFGPPSSRHAIAVPVYRRLSWDHWNYSVKQHCNGLLLLTDYMFVPYRNPYVCNPATGRYARLPCPCPPTPWWCSVEGVFLAFDPAVSWHHEVFFFPTEKQEHEEEQHESSYTKRREEKVFHVFVYSSRTGQWESREFTPGRSATGHLYDVVTTPRAKDERTWWSAKYWSGSLYVHCHSNVLMIIRCSQGKYDMVQLPGHAVPRSYLASHDRGILYATINKFQLECVCRAWRGIIDAHTLLFPRDFGGIFAAYHGYYPDFALFAPPAASRDGADQPPSYRRLFSVDLFSNVQQHCNGLFLVTGHHKFRPVLVPSVYNPATSRYARLPRPPGPWPCSVEGMFLAFDLAVSRHHEVIFLPTENLTPRQIRRQRQRHIQIEDKGPSWIDLEEPFLRNLFGEEQQSQEEEEQHESHAEEPSQINLEHPFLHNLFGKEQTPIEEQQNKEEQHESHSREEEPAGSASYESNVPAVEVPKEKVLHGFVFSSQTGQWKRHEFTPGRCAPADLYDLVTAPRGEVERTWWSVEYWCGSLYVHCHSGILMILHCSEGTYDMVQLPGQPDKSRVLVSVGIAKEVLSEL
ncbi:hypothetical protein ACQ4PT_028062 [Festuca glaucescens]